VSGATALVERIRLAPAPIKKLTIAAAHADPMSQRSASHRTIVKRLGASRLRVATSAPDAHSTRATLRS